MVSVYRIVWFAAVIFSMMIAVSCQQKDDPSEEEPFDEDAVPTLEYPAPINSEFHRIAYFPSYRDCSSLSIPDQTLQYIDYAYYAFASINNDFTVTIDAETNLTVLVHRCHKQGVKVVLSFNGSSEVFKKMVRKASSRKIFVDSVMELVDKFDLDGVDNDWEYPTAADDSADGNVSLMRDLSNRLHDPDVNKVLTMAITSGKYVGNYSNGIRSSISDCVDWFNVMSYDDFSTDTPGINHSTVNLLKTGYKYWVETRKFPASKFVGGIPCYGRPSGITQSGTVKTYSAIISAGGNPDADEAVVSSSSVNNYTIYYNGRKTVREKVRFCLDKATGGYFFWEAGQDTHDDTSLMKAAYEASIL
ncbi:MAG: glycoside hydrolase family 18 protein [Bacteroidales bacterium]|nr:glycoside hydrolase family 18 protein [Bacteroidales bacterium]